MSESVTTPSFAELWTMAINARLETVFTSLPGIVQSYDRASQKATIKAAVTVPLRSKSGDISYVELPVLPSVKVIFPSCKGVVFHFDIERGDGVLLNFSMREFGEWLRTADVVDPQHTDTHGPSGVSALVGFNPDPNVMSLDATAKMQLGIKDGPQILFQAAQIEAYGNSDAAARASSTNQQFNDLKAAITGWTPAPNDGGAALKAALSTWLGTVAAVGSTKLKIGG